MKSNTQALKLTVIGLMAAIELIFSFTPLGTIPIGPLAVTLNIIPIGISAVLMGPLGGGVMGGFFGLLSYLQCFGVGVPSEFGAELAAESTTDTAVLCIVSRIIAGAIAGIVHYILNNKLHANTLLCGALTGLCAAICNTLLFMSTLVLLFGDMPYIANMKGDMSIIVFIGSFVGVNAIIEMATSTLITAFAALGIKKTKLFG